MYQYIQLEVLIGPGQAATDFHIPQMSPQQNPTLAGCELVEQYLSIVERHRFKTGQVRPYPEFIHSGTSEGKEMAVDLRPATIHFRASNASPF